MTTKRTPDNLRYARELYESGKSLHDIGDILNISDSTAYAWVKDAGGTILKNERIRAAHTRHADIADEAIALFQSGMSVKAIASRFNVARHVITRHLKIAGITPRHRSASMYLRISQTNSDERVAITSASHAARKATLTSVSWRIQNTLAQRDNQTH